MRAVRVCLCVRACACACVCLTCVCACLRACVRVRLRTKFGGCIYFGRPGRSDTANKKLKMASFHAELDSGTNGAIFTFK